MSFDDMLTKPIIAVIGATGTGKSKLAIQIAKWLRKYKLEGECINADVVQMYKGLDIISNKVKLEEMEGIKHHFISTLENGTDYTVRDFVDDAKKKIDDIWNKNNVPVIVGGTHYYIQSLLFNSQLVSERYGLEKIEVDKSKREEINAALESDSIEILYNALFKIDPVVANKNSRDPRKLRRQLEIYLEFGKSSSELQQVESRRFDNTLIFWIHTDDLSSRLDARVDAMLEQGMVDEVKDFLSRYSTDHSFDYTKGVYQGIGFKEITSHLREGKELSLRLEEMKISTRQYAKRQVHWIKQKLGPLCLSTETPLIALPSDPENWHQVEEYCYEVVENFMNNKPLPEYNHFTNVSLNLKNEEKYEMWYCEKCDRKTYSATEKEIHLKSRKHKKIKLSYEYIQSLRTQAREKLNRQHNL